MPPAPPTGPLAWVGLAAVGTRPQTLYGIADSPVGLAAWLLDHGDGDGQPAAALVSALADQHGGLCLSSLLGIQRAASST
jgi:hypothetical protein